MHPIAELESGSPNGKHRCKEKAMIQKSRKSKTSEEGKEKSMTRGEMPTGWTSAAKLAT
jgi:hypothetical protein